MLHFENKQLQLYTGNYSQFEIQRASRLAQQAAAYEKQQQRIAEIHGFVSRRCQGNQSQAGSRVDSGTLERMEQIAPAHIDSPFILRSLQRKMSLPLLVLQRCRAGLLHYDPEQGQSESGTRNPPGVVRGKWSGVNQRW